MKQATSHSGHWCNRKAATRVTSLGLVAVARRASWVSGLLLVGLGLAIVQLVWLDQSHVLAPALATFTPTLTPEPIIPKRTATPAMTPTDRHCRRRHPLRTGSIAATGKSRANFTARPVAGPSHTASPTPNGTPAQPRRSA